MRANVYACARPRLQSQAMRTRIVLATRWSCKMARSASLEAPLIRLKRCIRRHSAVGEATRESTARWRFAFNGMTASTKRKKASKTHIVMLEVLSETAAVTTIYGMPKPRETHMTYRPSSGLLLKTCQAIDFKHVQS